MTNVLEFLENSAKIHSNKTVVEDIEKGYTYEQFVGLAKTIGSNIATTQSVRKPVIVFMEKSADALAAFMGIVYAGCFYVMVNPEHPTVRINQILKVSEAEYLITTPEYSEKLAEVEYNGKVVNLEDLMSGEIDENKLSAIREQSQDIDPLYCNFTSGSTGVPKGVLVGHRSVIDFMEYFTDLFNITENDIIGNQAPFDFDVSVKDIYSTFKTGATMVVIPKKLFSIPMQLLDYLCERKITTLIWAVSALCMITTLKGFTYKVPADINKVLFSGEAMPIKHLNQWKKYLPNVDYVNLYGPTEITCNCTYYRIDRGFEKGDVLPIGQAFPNEKVFLLDDEDKEITNANEPGELCVSGTALALGYYNNPEQTAKAFVQNPLNKAYMETIYRTGDLAYYNEAGELCFAGRKDFQIKHMGHRIELEEIEAAINGCNNVTRACCVFDTKRNKIVAFYVGEADKDEIHAYLSEKLPVFMIPNVFNQIDEMPLTQNGKIDRKSLLESCGGRRK